MTIIRQDEHERSEEREMEKRQLANGFEAYYKELELHRPKAGSKRNGRRRNPALPMVAAFLAGAIVIGGLAYSSDKQNWFTGGAAKGAAAGGTTAAAGTSAGMDAGVTTASVKTDGDIASIYEQASPAVVKVETFVETPQRGPIAADPLWPLFGGGGRGQGSGGTGGGGTEGGGAAAGGAELQLGGSGTGFFFEGSGYILTNAHVVESAREVKVTVQGYDEKLTAQVLGASSELDLAVLKVEHPEGGEFPALKLGDSDAVQVGEWVFAIGNPLGYDQTLTVGVLSAKERPLTIEDENGPHTFEHMLQTDAPINPGNSGGPLLNAQGQVIGINAAVNAEAQGIGFAIPTSVVKEALNELKSNTL